MALVFGSDKKLQFKVVGGSYVDVHIKEHNYNDRVRLIDTSDTSSGGKEAYEAGQTGGDYDMTAWFNTSQIPNATSPGIVPGAKADIKVGVGTSTEYIVPIIIESVGVRISHADYIGYNFRAKLDGTTGRTAFARPT